MAGIRLQVHFTFVLFLLWIVFSGLAGGKGMSAAVANGAFMLGLFGCVMLHELGHALTAKHYGILTKDITLLPIGGVARLERMPSDPWQELWVALAGPAVNVVIAAVLFVWLAAVSGGPNLGVESITTGSFAERIFIANVTLVLFNMLPAFPMDGGRVIGGVARLERMPSDPWQELWVALAGPAVNVVIAAVLFVWLAAVSGGPNLGVESITTGSFAERMFIANVTLVLFNMLPAFPMDGGRVIRALLATRLEYTKATEIAASLGQGMALLFGLVGFMYNPMLIFIAFFVWIGAGQEASMVLLHSALSGIPVRAAMITAFDTVGPEDPLELVAGLVLRGSQQDFPVMDGDQVVGVVTRDGLLRALAEKEATHAGEIMERDIYVAQASDMLEGAFKKLQECACHTVPVLHNGSLAGMLTAENVGEFLMIQSARQGRSLAGWRG